MIYFYVAPHKRKGNKVAKHFLIGARGGAVGCWSDVKPGILAFWGVDPQTIGVYRQARRDKRDFLYFDNAYFGRSLFFRATWNRRQHSGEGEPDWTRFDALGIRFAPWRKAGRHVLVCLQSPEWYERHVGTTIERWTRDVVGTIRKHTDRPIEVRRKPRPGEEWNIEDAIAGAHCVVTHSSAAATDALMAGVPVFVTDPESAAYRMGSPDLSQIETPYFPDDRDRWAAVLAGNQWTKAELKDGTAWRTLSKGS